MKSLLATAVVAAVLLGLAPLLAPLPPESDGQTLLAMLSRSDTVRGIDADELRRRFDILLGKLRSGGKR